uniref:Uncharacterized protein n=1 Tax=Anguilla anguilla TaxID=7936 RepID=A0A0E9V7D4_ANGAN
MHSVDSAGAGRSLLGCCFL